MRALVEENTHLRKRALLDGRDGRGRSPRKSRAGDGTPRKRGRAFKFTADQANEFRKQAEGGKSAVALAKELKVSLPTMYNTLKRAGWKAGGRRGRGSARAARASNGVPRKRGRAFKFTADQASEIRKQVEGGKSAVALARELKVSLPTMYNTLRRVGWKARAGRARGSAPRAARMRNGTPRKRGRAFKFTADQAGEFRKQVEAGKSAASLAKELKVSLPTMYSTLKRGGWKGRR
ncbi:MAG TPA: hypothetical protein VFE93_08475 [Myxococcaceae bacterium]|nr:hypothetical protein [Myxococcaceae bacterium]